MEITLKRLYMYLNLGASSLCSNINKQTWHNHCLLHSMTTSKLHFNSEVKKRQLYLPSPTFTNIVWYGWIKSTRPYIISQMFFWILLFCLVSYIFLPVKPISGNYNLRVIWFYLTCSQWLVKHAAFNSSQKKHPHRPTNKSPVSGFTKNQSCWSLKA